MALTAGVLEANALQNERHVACDTGRDKLIHLLQCNVPVRALLPEPGVHCVVVRHLWTLHMAKLQAAMLMALHGASAVAGQVHCGGVWKGGYSPLPCCPSALCRQRCHPQRPAVAW